MTVSITESAVSAEVDGVTYYFCCEHCRSTFVGAAH
jgi:YHS domain-containing protein